MGQQQLLLVILVTIIVGIATVVAINTFGSASKNSNLDAVRQDLASIASGAQGYYMKPSTLGGGSNSFSSITWDDIGTKPCKTDGNTNCVDGNGTYVLGSGSAGQVQVTAYPSSNDSYTADDASSSPTLTATIEPNDISISQ